MRVKCVYWSVIVFYLCAAVSNAAVFLDIYESDGVTPFDFRTIPVGTTLKLVVASDANDFWSGGLFIRGDNRPKAVLSGTGYDPNTRDYTQCHFEGAGPEARVIHWEDSYIDGFDLLDSNSLPGALFMIDYTALAPGDPNVGFYEYSVSWKDPNLSVTFHQVPKGDFDLDGFVNLRDFTVFSYYWQQDGCTWPEGCGRADFDNDGSVGLGDLLLFAEDWMWGVPEPNIPDPVPAPASAPVQEPDPNLIFSIVNSDGFNEISMDVGQTITLFVDMNTLDINRVWAFEVEVGISDPNFGSIDTTAYDPNNPPGPGTARILADPNRWEMFDYWGPGLYQEEGIYMLGVSAGQAFNDGHMASFEYTCQAAGDVVLSISYSYIISTSGESLCPATQTILIHQNELETLLMGSEMVSSPTAATMESTSSVESISTAQADPSVSVDEMVQFLEELWLTEPDMQETISEQEWNEFIDSVKSSY